MRNNFRIHWSTKLAAWLILIVPIYLIGSFVNVNLNPLDWGTFSRVVFGIYTVISGFLILVKN